MAIDAVKAARVINDLFGLKAEWVNAAVDEMGFAALSDAALIWIAERQLAEDSAEPRLEFAPFSSEFRRPR